MTHSGGKPHAVGDRGQRYEVRWTNREQADVTRVFGWCDTKKGAEEMADSWGKAPYVTACWVFDRRPNEATA